MTGGLAPVNPLIVLIEWVESGKAPEKISIVGPNAYGTQMGERHSYV